MTTRGDQILDRTLSKVGGKGLFVKELEVAMAEGRADLAVHSLKDVPMELPEGFALAAVLEREDPRDAFVSNDYASLDDLPAGAIVGTSSLRRQSLIAARYPHLVIKPLRGNLDTRLGKLDRGDYAAIILAAAGLKRLGLPERIRACWTRPAACRPPGRARWRSRSPTARRRRPAALLAPLNHLATAQAVTAERKVSKGVWRQLPGAAGRVCHRRRTARCICARWSPRRTAAHGQRRSARPASQPEELGAQVAELLRAQDAVGILAACLSDAAQVEADARSAALGADGSAAPADSASSSATDAPDQRMPAPSSSPVHWRSRGRWRPAWPRWAAASSCCRCWKSRRCPTRRRCWPRCPG
jgi:hydroxymethylbilane synthase